MKLIVIPPPPLEFSTSGPVHMILGQLTDPGVNFALVHVLTPVTVQMSSCRPGATLRGSYLLYNNMLPHLSCQSDFSSCEQNGKDAPIINVCNKFFN